MNLRLVITNYGRRNAYSVGLQHFISENALIVVTADKIRKGRDNAQKNLSPNKINILLWFPVRLNLIGRRRSWTLTIFWKYEHDQADSNECPPQHRMCLIFQYMPQTDTGNTNMQPASVGKTGWRTFVTSNKSRGHGQGLLYVGSCNWTTRTSLWCTLQTQARVVYA